MASVDPAAEITERQLKRSGDSVQNTDRGLLSPHLDQRDVGAIELASTRQVFLGQVEFVSSGLHLNR